jgi:prepilin-type N-terminal cleavage/methylation domain-containing protein
MVKTGMKAMGRWEGRRGYTLVEVMVTVGIVGVLFGVAPRLVLQTVRFFSINATRLELQRDARNVSEIMTTRLRQAVASSIFVDQSTTPTPQPPYSRIRFQTIQGSTITFWQEDKKIYIVDSAVSNTPKMLSDNLRYLSFAFVDSQDDTLMTVNLSFEKSSFQNKRVFQANTERVRIFNQYGG